jgi:hypothetical protein
MSAKVTGIAYLINRLEKFDKDVSKELKKEMRSAANDLLRESRSAFPPMGLTNWGMWISSEDGRNLSYGGNVKKGLKLETTRKRVRAATVAFGYTVSQMSPAGAIIAFAGSVTAGAFNDSITRKYGRASRAPRFMTPAYYAVIPAVRSKIEKSIEDAMRKVGQ